MVAPRRRTSYQRVEADIAKLVALKESGALREVKLEAAKKLAEARAGWVAGDVTCPSSDCRYALYGVTCDTDRTRRAWV